MEARVENPTFFKKILDAIREIEEEVNIDCNETGLSLQTMDDTHASLVSMYLNRKYFESYKCKSNITLGVDLDCIHRILKCGGINDVLTLKTNDENTELKFKLEDVGRCSEFSVRLLEINSEHLTISEDEPDASIKMPSNEFQKMCRDLEQFGSSVKISVKKNQVTFSVNGNGVNGSIMFSSLNAADNSKQIEIKYDSNETLDFFLVLII